MRKVCQFPASATISFAITTRAKTASTPRRKIRANQRSGVESPGRIGPRTNQTTGNMERIFSMPERLDQRAVIGICVRTW